MRPYQRYYKEELILRDYLAIDRTILANERTFLAYVRTALALFVAGMSFVKFFDSLPMAILGWMMVPVGIAVLVVGIVRYQQMRVAMPSRQAPPSTPADDTPHVTTAGNV